jgi:hypothetical protein
MSNADGLTATDADDCKIVGAWRTLHRRKLAISQRSNAP